MTTQNYGMVLPTQTAMLAGNPRDSAIAAQANSNNKLTALNKAVGGRKRGKRAYKHKKTCKCKWCKSFLWKGWKGGAADSTNSTITVPQFTMQYTPANGPGQTPNDIIKQNSQITTQGTANAVYDKYASQKGGYIYDKKVLNSMGSKKTKSSIRFSNVSGKRSSRSSRFNKSVRSRTRSRTSNRKSIKKTRTMKKRRR